MPCIHVQTPLADRFNLYPFYTGGTCRSMDAPLCFICADDGVPGAIATPCTCKDRYAHPGCLVRMIASRGVDTRCPVCCATYRGVRCVRRRSLPRRMLRCTTTLVSAALATIGASAFISATPPIVKTQRCDEDDRFLHVISSGLIVLAYMAATVSYVCTCASERAKGYEIRYRSATCRFNAHALE